MSPFIHQILSRVVPSSASQAISWADNLATPVSGITLSLAAILIVVATVAIGLVTRLQVQRETNRRLSSQFAERDDAERAVRAADSALWETARRMPLGIFKILDSAMDIGRIAWVGGDSFALFGIEPDDMHLVRERIHPDDVLVFERLLAPGTNRQPFSVDLRAFGRDGLGWVRAVVIPHVLPDGTTGTIGYFVDTSELNAHNEALRIARDVAERASKAKADFLATMSHEIRTPMNGVIGMLELLGRTPINAEQKELLHTVEDSAGVLLQVLNDILDFSKLESGDLRLDETPLDPRVLIDNTAAIMAPRAREKGLDLRLEVDAAIAGTLLGDGTRLRQILLNLIGNAVKFTDRGSIAIRMILAGDDGTNQTIRISIVDTGIGIAHDSLSALFTPFAQAEASIGRRYGGTGLGLAISRHLAQLMEGTVDLQSEPGSGTTAVFEVRLAVHNREVDAPKALGGLHAVVRLSDAETAVALGEYLRALGMTMELSAPSQPLREGMAARLLFVDEDDTDSESRIRARVVALTGNALRPTDSPADNGRLFLGANPLSWQSLVRICVSAVEQSNRPTIESRELGLESSVRRGHILVAEDHPVSQKLIARQLGTLGLSFDVVDNGLDALEALDSHDYDLLLTDCNMPLMSGYELARAWRERERKSAAKWRLPIVAMTANALAGEAARVRDAGMDGVITKPLRLLPLSQTIDQWLHVRADTRSSAMPMWGTEGLTDTGPDHDRDFFAEMLQDFSVASRDDLARLRQSGASGDAAAAAQSLHRLLGALQLFDDGALLAEGKRLLAALHAEPPEEDCLEKVGSFTDKVDEWLLVPLSQSRAPGGNSYFPASARQ